MEQPGGGPPAGLTFADGVLSGTPTQIGTFQLVVQATDPTGALNDSRVFSLTVASGANLPISPATIPVGSLDTSYSQTFTGPAGTTLSYTIGNGTYADLQAEGLQIIQSSQFPSVLSLVGTPSAVMPGDGSALVLNVTCTDAAGNSSTQAYPIAVAYTPAEISQAYGLTGLSGNGAGQTVVIIDGGDAPNLVSSNDPNFDSSDLHQFDLQFNLPDPPEFLKLDAFGGTNFPTNPPSGTNSEGQTVNTGETTQDVEWVHGPKRWKREHHHPPGRGLRHRDPDRAEPPRGRRGVDELHDGPGLVSGVQRGRLRPGLHLAGGPPDDLCRRGRR